MVKRGVYAASAFARCEIRRFVKFHSEVEAHVFHIVEKIMEKSALTFAAREKQIGCRV